MTGLEQTLLVLLDACEDGDVALEWPELNVLLLSGAIPSPLCFLPSQSTQMMSKSSSLAKREWSSSSCTLTEFAGSYSAAFQRLIMYSVTWSWSSAPYNNSLSGHMQASWASKSGSL